MCTNEEKQGVYIFLDNLPPPPFRKSEVLYNLFYKNE